MRTQNSPASLPGEPGASDQSTMTIAEKDAEFKAPTVGTGVLHNGLTGTGAPPSIKHPLTIRTPDEILGMQFDENDVLLGDGLLAKGQPMTLLGPGGLGKSRLLLQLMACMITGRDFVGFKTRAAGMKWLLLQTQNSNRRLQQDLKALQTWLDKDWSIVNEHLVIHTVELEFDGFLSLGNADTRLRLQDVLARVAPGAVSFDPLEDFASGDLNRDCDMRTACQAVTAIAHRGDPNRPFIVVHHALTGRAGALKATGWDRSSFGRNSKLLHAWTRAQINVAPGLPNSNDVLVLSCGKNSNGKEFAPLAVRLNVKTMIYEPDPLFNMSIWQEELAGTNSKGPLVSVETVSELCEAPVTKASLVKSIRAETGCGSSYAYKQIDEAVDAGIIRFDEATKTYVRA